MSEATPRLGLPLLAAGQAQKEVYHNEALTVIDALLQPAVETVGDDAPPPAPAEGQSWLVGGAPTGVWAGHANALATWTGGGWRFGPPREGMSIWVSDRGLWARWSMGAWTLGIVAATAVEIGGLQVVGSRQAAIPEPAGGSSIDDPARAAIGAILAALRGHGLIAT